MIQPLLEVKELRKVYRTPSRTDFVAVAGVSFALNEGETLGIVGESGSGKTTVAKMIAGMIPATSGEIRLRGELLRDKRDLEKKRSIQYIFQDPVSSLNPRMKVKKILEEPLKLYFKTMSKAERERRIDAVLEDVGLSPVCKDRYPRELSGGQCQRVGIARALLAEPRVIVCDEPTSALDMTIQSQILDLLKDLQQRHHLSYLFIAHGLEVIYTISHRVLVMHRGEVVETGDTKQIFHSPSHPYTQSLIDSIPKIHIPYHQY
jgi:ABC-type oligopeptide transport system ATPase subunit